MKDRRSEDAFSYAPLRDTDGLSTVDKHLARTAARKTDDSMGGVTLESTFVYLDAIHVGTKCRRPPLPDED